MAHIGDLIPKSGMYTEPGVITSKKNDGSVTVDTDPMAINKYHRYANTSGLTEPEKLKFNEILDNIYAKEDNGMRLNDIQLEIDNLKTDPNNRNIVRFLRNQQAVLIRETQTLPRTYNMDESAVNS